MSGVANVYIYCGVHASTVESYIKRSRWHHTSHVSPFQVIKCIKTTAHSVGDVMRDLDSRDLITGDFILIYGDLISNLPITGALARHKARKNADKNAIMTMILRSAGLGPHRTASKGISPVFVVDPTINRCLHYEEIHPLQAKKYINIDPELLKTHTQMEVRSDLIDCGIDICTPDVLALWSESFDYEIPRRHFLHGVLKDYELNGKTIHTDIVEDHYAARVSNLQMYEAVSKDILSRWTYPFVPDSNFIAGQSYKFERGGFYKENGVILARTCKIGKRTVLGGDTSIDDGSFLQNSIIGRRCRIGRNVKIENAYIWDDVIIGDGSIVNRAVVASKCVIGKDCDIQAGSLLSYSVRIADNQVVKEGQKITRSNHTLDDSPEKPLELTDLSLVGKDGEGYLYIDDSDEGNEGLSFHNSLIYSSANLNISNSSISTFASTISRAESPLPGIRHPSFNGSTTSNSDPRFLNESFHNDAVNGLLDTLKENGDFDSARLEFMGLRLSNDATDHQIRRAIAIAFSGHISQLVDDGNLDALKATTHTLDAPGAENFLKHVAIASKQIDSQVDFISCLQTGLTHKASGAAILAAMSQSLYSRDIIEEEAYLKWWRLCEEKALEETEEMKKVREKTVIFIQWLTQAESESSSEGGDYDSE